MLFNAKKSTVAVTLAVLLLSSLGAMQVLADNDEHERREHRESHERREHRESHEGREYRGSHKGHDAGRKGRMLTATNATFQAECSACHMAYPPGLLSAASWKAMMGTLDKHFGTDASLDQATIAEILPFLEANAGASRKADSGVKPVLRITETGWFKHEHDEISPATWKRDSIKSASNCMACHTSADKGNFDEDNVRIPK